MAVAGTGGRGRGAAGGDPVLEDTAKGRAEARANLADIAQDPDADLQLRQKAKFVMKLFN